MTETKLIGRYELKEQIGKGGMATVYKGYDPIFERDVAIKVMSKELSAQETFSIRFKREAKIVAALEHPAIVPVYDFGEEDEKTYIIMRLMAGGSMEDVLNEKGLYAFENIVPIIKRLCSALVEAHEQGIIHRDLKPANVLFDHRGDAFLTDFGIAKLLEDTQELTKTGILGTLEYMSPEQAQGDDVIDHRSDIYSMSLMIYEMLTGQGPFLAETPIQIALKHLYEAPPNILDINSELPKELGNILLKALEKLPEDRYQNIVDLVTELESVDSSNGKSEPTPEISDGMKKSLEKSEVVDGAAKIVNNDGVEFSIDKETVVVGRNAALDIDLTDLDKNKFVSKQHAEFINKDGIWYIRAHKNAKNPTLVNEAKLKKGEEIILKQGDEIAFADIPFVFNL